MGALHPYIEIGTKYRNHLVAGGSGVAFSKIDELCTKNPKEALAW